MSRTRRAALVLAVAVAFGGCGGDDSTQFRDDYNAAVARLAAVNTQIAQATASAAPQSNRRIAREFRRIARTADRARRRLARLDPPKDAKAEYDRLLSALRDGVRDLDAVAAAARRDDPRAARRAVRSLGRSGEEITAAENALRKAVDG
jgi:23S rRNA A2030 N6-methylase RlmJ